jgi:hypothetical protein
MGNASMRQACAISPLLLCFGPPGVLIAPSIYLILKSSISESKNSDLQIIAVSIDKEPAKARAYMRDKKYHFPVISFDAALVERSMGSARGLPCTILIDRHGRVAVHELGEMFEEDVLALQRFATVRNPIAKSFYTAGN